MMFTMQALTRSLADYLSPALPGVHFYDNPNQQGTQMPAMFLQRTKSSIKSKVGHRFLRKIGLDLVCLVDCNRTDMDDQYTAAADILDEMMELFPYSSGENRRTVQLRTFERNWTIQDQALHYKFELNIWVSRQEDDVFMRSIQSYTEEVS